jgi:signal peptidase I
MKKVAWVGRVFSVFLYILVLVFGVSIAAVLLLGLKLYCIQTGSMEPDYPVGMMIVVEPVSFDSLETGDVITFAKDSNTVVTHRIVEIDREQQLITTKGDNNNVQDGAPVSYRNVVGRVKFGVRGIGYFILVLNTNFGKWMLAIVMVALIGIEIIRRMYYHDKFEEEAENAETDEHNVELM